jgi:hypothetical protein
LSFYSKKTDWVFWWFPCHFSKGVGPVLGFFETGFIFGEFLFLVLFWINYIDTSFFWGN